MMGDVMEMRGVVSELVTITASSNLEIEHAKLVTACVHHALLHHFNHILRILHRHHRCDLHLSLEIVTTMTMTPTEMYCYR